MAFFRQFAVLLAAVAAFGQTAAAPKPATAKPKPSAAKAKPAAPRLEPGLYATLATSMGSIRFRLYEKESPITVQNFVDLATGKKEWSDPKTGQRVKRPLYTGLTFHRVIPEFMIQGGDPEGTGMGGTDTIPDEFHPSLMFDRPGRVAMANAGPRTGSSQFFITESPQPHLNGRHTIFGQVVSGQAVVNRIARVPADPDDNRPRTPVKILRVTFRRVGPGPRPPSAPAPTSRRPATSQSRTPQSRGISK